MRGGSPSAAEVLRGYLASSELAWEEAAPGSYVVTLRGERRLATTCSLVVGAHTLSVNAFVARCPEENREAVFRWLLERNARSYVVGFAVDHLGDIYLAGRLPLHAVTLDEVDRFLGSVLDLADSSFNPILELGFPSAIRAEWAWRTSRGESTANLAAFRHLTGD